MDPIKKFDLPTRFAINQIRFDPNSKKDHKLEVIKLCIEAIENDIDFVTRARLETNTSHERLVADFCDVTMGIVVEVQDSESDKSIMRKSEIWKKYGFSFNVVKICRKN